MTTIAKCGLDDFFASGRTRLDLDAMIVDTLPGDETDWGEPIPLDDPSGPPFPLDALAGIIGAHVAAVAEETQTPPDLGAIVALGTISAAAGGKYELVIPEQRWKEPVHIQTVAVADPGNRKSAIFRIITGPIAAYERTIQPDERRAFAQWESRGRTLEKAVSAAESSATKAPQDGTLPNSEAVRMAAVDALEEHRAERPRITRLIVDDATSEAVKSLLAEQGGAIGVLSAESAFLSNTAGSRYSDAPNLDVLIYGHAGESIRVDRKGRPDETVERACLTLCLMVQPQVISDLGKVPGFITRWAAPRLLPCFPTDILGRRRIDVTPVPDHLTNAWSAIVTRIVERKPALRDGSYVPWPLSLDAEAIASFRAYYTWHEPQMAKDGAFGDIRDWAAKQCGAVLRIAGLLHIATHERPEDTGITADTITKAIAIGRYFEHHARIMYRVMHGHGSHHAAQQVLDVIHRLAHESGVVTRSDLRKSIRGRTAFAQESDLTKPLALLKEFGWIRVVKQETGARPTYQIFLNPRKDIPEIPEIPRSGLGEGISGISGMSSTETNQPTPIRPEPLPPTGTWSMEI